MVFFFCSFKMNMNHWIRVWSKCLLYTSNAQLLSFILRVGLIIFFISYFDYLFYLYIQILKTIKKIDIITLIFDTPVHHPQRQKELISFFLPISIILLLHLNHSVFPHLFFLLLFVLLLMRRNQIWKNTQIQKKSQI